MSGSGMGWRLEENAIGFQLTNTGPLKPKVSPLDMMTREKTGMSSTMWSGFSFSPSTMGGKPMVPLASTPGGKLQCLPWQKVAEEVDDACLHEQVAHVVARGVQLHEAGVAGREPQSVVAVVEVQRRVQEGGLAGIEAGLKVHAAGRLPAGHSRCPQGTGDAADSVHERAGQRCSGRSGRAEQEQHQGPQQGHHGAVGFMAPPMGSVDRRRASKRHARTPTQGDVIGRRRGGLTSSAPCLEEIAGAGKHSRR